ncbi:MAG: hypothetical protein ACE5HB_09995, partial [Terriglobia bacterium]
PGRPASGPRARMTEPATPARALPRRYLKATLAGGAGGLAALAFFVLEQRPELARLLLERVLIAWGPQFVIVLLLFAFLYLLADRYAPRLIAAQRETALALQHLAQAVEQLVARENAFQREQDVLLNHVARRVDALYRLLDAQRRALNGHLARLARGFSRRPRDLSRSVSSGKLRAPSRKPQTRKQNRNARGARASSS